MVKVFLNNLSWMSFSCDRIPAASLPATRVGSPSEYNDNYKMLNLKYLFYCGTMFALHEVSDGNGSLRLEPFRSRRRRNDTALCLASKAISVCS